MKFFLMLSLLLPLNSYAKSVDLTTGEFLPFVGSNLHNGGLASEIVTQIFSDMGDQAIISFRPWKRGFSETLSGKYLGTFPYSKNKEREKTLYFSNPIYELKEQFFTKKRANIIYKQNQDLFNLRICKPLGYNLFGLKKLSNEKKITLASPKSMEHCFKMLASDRVDMVLTNEITGWGYIDKLFANRSQFTMTEKSFVKIGHYFVIPKSNHQGEEIMKTFNSVLDKLKQSGEIDLIRRKHIK